MEGYSHSPIVELIPNPVNHHDVNDPDHVGNSMSEEDTSSLTSSPPRRNQSSPNNIGYDQSINPPLDSQLQSLSRIDSIGEAINSRIIRLSHPYEGALDRNNIINQQIQAPGNSGIGPSPAYEIRLYDGNYPNQQTLVGNPEMRQRYGKVTSLEDVRGKVVSMSKEEYGSQLLVKVLDGKKPGDIKFIIREVLDHLHDLMMNWFGKHVIEKIFHVLDVEQVTLLFELITKDIFQFKIVCENDIGYATISKPNYLYFIS